ncbi:hypothetical protein RMATCC62417_02508 [Rhizopus microsporus]|nr:hypothetical protein RMATCC62417_02508 [Rhizopus microsporus]
MNQLSTIGVHSKGFSPFLGARFYSHIVRAQLEYGLAITKITTFLNKQLEDAQNACLRRIFDGSHTSSTMVMLHMSKLPNIQERAYTLQSTSSLGHPFGRDAPRPRAPGSSLFKVDTTRIPPRQPQ